MRAFDKADSKRSNVTNVTDASKVTTLTFGRTVALGRQLSRFALAMSLFRCLCAQTGMYTLPCPLPLISDFLFPGSLILVNVTVKRQDEC